ncbi:MAG: ScyD/ScyE family protein [Dehalococcoidia bacterium]
MKKPSAKVLVAGLAATAVSLSLFGSASADDPFVATGLKAPRGITSIGHQVLIAEQGSGRIVRISDSGTKTVIASGLPTTIADTPEGPLAAGPDAVIQVGSVYYFTVGESGTDKGFDSVYSVTEGGKAQLIAELLPIEKANNFDGGFESPGKPELIVNAYDLAWDGKNGLFVSASGANTIFHVSLDGKVKPYAIFKERPNPLFPGLGGPTMDTVPTGIAVGPDGALYVSTLTGFPFPQGGAVVYRMEDKDKDGDAMEPGETTVFASGLSTATDLAFDKDGSLLVAQFSLDMLSEAPGNVVRIKNGVTSVVGAPLVSPTGITVLADGTILVAQEFLGVVADINSATAIVKSAGGPGGPGGAPAGGPATPPPSGGTVRPPSTGDAGLADSDGANAWLPVAALLAVMATVGGGVLAVSRNR